MLEVPKYPFRTSKIIKPPLEHPKWSKYHNNLQHGQNIPKSLKCTKISLKSQK